MQVSTREEQHRKLLACRENAVMNNPLLVSLALGMTLLPDEKGRTTTLCTDGRRLYYNVGFMARQNLAQANYGYQHELLHCLLGHPPRCLKLFEEYKGEVGETRCYRLIQVAADHVVNLLIDDLSLVTARSRATVRDSKIRLEDPAGATVWRDPRYTGWSLEDVFLDLRRNKDDQDDKSGETFFGEIECLPDEDDGEGVVPIDWDAVRASARRMAASFGNLPASLARQLDPVPSRCKWRHALREFLVADGRPRMNWRGGDRRSRGGVFIPDHHRSKTLDGVFAFDTSGSIGDDILGRMLGQMMDCLRETTWSKLTVYSCDAEVRSRQVFGPGQKVAAEFKGGGGTSFIPVIEDIQERGEPCRFLVYFTDGEGAFPAKAPPFPVLWIHFGRTGVRYPAWAKVIRIEERDLLQP